MSSRTFVGESVLVKETEFAFVKGTKFAFQIPNSDLRSPISYLARTLKSVLLILSTLLREAGRTPTGIRSRIGLPLILGKRCRDGDVKDCTASTQYTAPQSRKNHAPAPMGSLQLNLCKMTPARDEDAHVAGSRLNA